MSLRSASLSIGAAGIVALFGFALIPALLLILLFLFTRLFSAAFFQLVVLLIHGRRYRSRLSPAPRRLQVGVRDDARNTGVRTSGEARMLK